MNSRNELINAQWRKSSRSNGQNNCVEVAAVAAHVGVRDSKRPAQPALVVGRYTWSAFARQLRDGSLG